MFFAEAQIRVHLYGQPTDMRKSYDGLQALARHAMGRDPLDGALYIFVNRRGSQIKCLYFDRSGFCIWGKRLESGRFIGDWRAVRTRAYHVLKYRRPVIKLKASAKILALPAPAGVLEGSRADVSFAAGLLMDKFAWHLPLYRQHQRLAAAGIRVSRPWLTQLAQAVISLLAPIYEAQFASIRSSRVKAMDETPIKAGRAGHGKMHTGYFWPIYGQLDEVCFPFHSSRSADFVCHAWGIKPVVNAVLLTDGYAAYAQYAEKTGINHARCWAHGRRTFFDALTAEPAGAAEALEQIKAMYGVEEEIRDRKLAGDAKQLHRLTHSKPLVTLFFEWVDRQLERQGFTPTNPFIQALNYVRERRAGLEVFLTDPDVPIDTNHLERALRVVPMGRNYRPVSIMHGSRPAGEAAARESRSRLLGRIQARQRSAFA